MGTSQTRYTAEFRVEAVKQVVERGYPVREVATRLGVSTWSLYQWLRAYRQADSPSAAAGQDAAAEIRQLKAELRRVTEERDILSRRSRNQRSNTMAVPPAAR